jgi:cytochrome P450
LHPRYAYLRENEPLAPVKLPYGDPAWLVTGYHDVRAVLTDPRLSRAPGRDEPRTTPEVSPVSTTPLIEMDPPAHTRARTLVAKAFNARRVEGLRERTQQVATELVDAMVAAGPPVDLVTGLARQLPIVVICELLGVPAGDRSRVAVWSEAMMSTTSLRPAKAREYFARQDAYVAMLIRRRRREPTTADLLGALVQACDDAGHLSERELRSHLSSLLWTGLESSTAQLPNIVYTLLTHGDSWQQVCARPQEVPTAVEELMRYIPLGSYAGLPRYATEDVPLAGGVVAAGQAVLVSVEAANLDGRVFADPDRLDLARNPNPHLGFGHGIHHCLGALLARMELQVGLATLACRLPGLRLAVPAAQVRWRTGTLIRAPVALPVTW